MPCFGILQQANLDEKCCCETNKAGQGRRKQGGSGQGQGKDKAGQEQGNVYVGTDRAGQGKVIVPDVQGQDRAGQGNCLKRTGEGQCRAGQGRARQRPSLPSQLA